MSLERCPWYIAGPVLGLLIVGLRAVVNKPFGVLGGFIDVAENAATPRRLGFRAYLLGGLILGGALYAVASQSFSLSLGYDGAVGLMGLPAQVGVLLVAGVAMGFGARTAGGCTSGHGMSGVSLGSTASIASSMTFFGAAVVFAHALLWLGGAR